MDEDVAAAAAGDSVCRVCGDSAGGMFFGALVCVPCKVAPVTVCLSHTCGPRQPRLQPSSSSTFLDDGMGGKRRGKRGEGREEGDGRTNPKPAATGLNCSNFPYIITLKLPSEN